MAKAINELQANKSSGVEDITAELVKCGNKCRQLLSQTLYIDLVKAKMA